MPYADADDLTARFDWRIIADLASDSGTQVEESALTSDAKVSVALDDASGRIDAALSVAQVYTAADLSGLSGNSLAMLKRITCELAMAFLVGRRQEKMLDDSVARVERKAEEYLDRLRKGERLFGDVAAATAAGLPTVDGPTTIQYEGLNLLPDRTRNFYPGRQSRLPIGR